MNPAVASVKAVGERLEKACQAAGVTPDELAKKINVGRTTIYRWFNGEQEGGAVQIATAGMIAGVRPDNLLLEDPGQVAAPELDDDETLALAQIREHIIQISRMTKGLRKPARAVEAMLREVITPYEEPAADKIPPGTTIQQPEPEIRTYEPPPPPASKKKGRSVENFGTLAGEPPIRYGAKRRKSE